MPGLTLVEHGMVEHGSRIIWDYGGAACGDKKAAGVPDGPDD